MVIIMMYIQIYVWKDKLKTVYNTNKIHQINVYNVKMDI